MPEIDPKRYYQQQQYHQPDAPTNSPPSSEQSSGGGGTPTGPDPDAGAEQQTLASPPAFAVSGEKALSILEGILVQVTRTDPQMSDDLKRTCGEILDAMNFPASMVPTEKIASLASGKHAWKWGLGVLAAYGALFTLNSIRLRKEIEKLQAAQQADELAHQQEEFARRQEERERQEESTENQVNSNPAPEAGGGPPGSHEAGKP